MPQSNRVIPFASSALVFLLFEVVYQRPNLIFWTGAGVLIVFFAAIKLLIRERGKTLSWQLVALITPTLLSWSALAFSLLLDAAVLRHLLAFFTAALLVIFFEAVVTYTWRQEAYKGYSLENFSAYALTLTVFLGSSVLFGLKALLNFNLGLALLIFLAAILIMNFKLFWISGLSGKPLLLFTGVLTLVLFELFVSFTFLPFHFMISGAALTVLWYTGAIMARARLLGLLTKKMAYKHLVLGSALLVLLFSAARWD